MLKWLQKYWPILALIAVWFVFECAMSWAAFCDHVNYPTYENATEENNCVFRGPAVSIIRFLIRRWERVFDKPDAYVALFTAVLAVFTIVLASVGRRQTKDSRILNRAWLGVEPCGVSTYIPREKPDAPKDQILGHFGIHNAGHLAARNVRWGFDSKFSDEEIWRVIPLDNLDWYGGANVIPPGITMRQGAKALAIPARNRSKYLYVWGRVEYEDGFTKPRWTNFCHRYNLKRLKPRTVKGQRIESEYGRYYERGNEAI